MNLKWAKDHFINTCDTQAVVMRFNGDLAILANNNTLLTAKYDSFNSIVFETLPQIVLGGILLG